MHNLRITYKKPARETAAPANVVAPAGAPVEDDSRTPSHKFLAACNAEAAAFKEKLKASKGSTWKRARGEGARMLQCELGPFCPKFSRQLFLEEHIEKFHSKAKMYCGESNKHLDVAMALWDNDHVLGNPCVGNVLQRSSAIMRSTVLPALPPGLKAGTQADKRLRIVFGNAGPMAANAETLAAELATRRVGNAYYSLGFAHTLFQQALLAKGSIKETTRAVAGHFVNQGSELVSLLPRDTDNIRSCWEAMLADVFFSPAADNLLRQLLDRCHHHSEFRSLSTDCTFRMMFSLFGQASYRAPKVVRADQALDEQEARHALFTVRLFSGPVVCATAIYMENTDCMIRVLESELSEEHRLQVVHVSNDDPSPKLLRGLKRIMWNHEVLSMDPMHPAFTYEQAQGRKKTPGSTLLRRILCRIVARDSQGPSGPYYDGSSKPQATDEEITLLQAIEDCSMPEREAGSRPL